MIEDSNQKTYEDPSIVHHYAQLKILQPAERTILELFQTQLPSMKMLDIGVGGGRTTQYFSKVVAEYIGIDYSADMVAACQQRFSKAAPTVLFEVCDARDMSRFADNSFDFILFSFNGIDSISHSERLQVFQEVFRLGKSGSYFVFSSHNLQAIEREFSFKKQLSLNPISTYINLVMLGLLRFFNRSITSHQLKTSNYLMIRDEPHNFRLKNYYIRPQAQINQLESNFTDIKVYSWKDGLELNNDTQRLASSDLWLYYLCTIR